MLIEKIVVLDLRILLITVALFSGCISDKKLAEKCQSKFPCVEKSATVVLTVKHDTVYNYQPLPPLPLAGIKCFQFDGKETIEIFRVPCTCVNTTKTIEKTVIIADSAKIYLLLDQLTAMRKDSVKTAQLVFELKNSTDKKAYLYKWGFWGLAIALILLIAFTVYRLTRKTSA